MSQSGGEFARLCERQLQIAFLAVDVGDQGDARGRFEVVLAQAGRELHRFDAQLVAVDVGIGLLRGQLQGHVEVAEVQRVVDGVVRAVEAAAPVRAGTGQPVRKVADLVLQGHDARLHSGL